MNLKVILQLGCMCWAFYLHGMHRLKMLLGWVQILEGLKGWHFTQIDMHWLQRLDHYPPVPILVPRGHVSHLLVMVLVGHVNWQWHRDGHGVESSLALPWVGHVLPIVLL